MSILFYLSITVHNHERMTKYLESTTKYLVYTTYYLHDLLYRYNDINIMNFKLRILFVRLSFLDLVRNKIK